ncbi:lysoplasmalogenase TMEM86B [Microcaecilia unicolor]|uniref:lysoplasmalogenase n=1 Tax=Microcaecilia unicolor TaxID=1415580 RepID=A0A6P7XDG3_9AMPH|nr:lysoplasmalogenase [Microcaecilia unicolor]
MDLLEPNGRRTKKTLATVRSHALRLLPFVLSSAAFFTLCPPPLEPGWFSALMKCLPILSLTFFVLIHGISQGGPSPYAWKILLGLLFSAAGDACLVWPDLFLHGMVLFGLAHLLYILAFGLRPFQIRLFLLLAVLGGSAYVFLLPYLQGILVYAAGAYTVLIAAMVWRALTGARRTPYGRSQARVSSAAGALSFMVSDGILAVDKFCFPLPHAQLLVMASYYLAQVLIAVSVTQPSRIDELWKVE